MFVHALPAHLYMSQLTNHPLLAYHHLCYVDVCCECQTIVLCTLFLGSG